MAAKLERTKTPSLSQARRHEIRPPRRRVSWSAGPPPGSRSLVTTQSPDSGFGSGYLLPVRASAGWPTTTLRPRAHRRLGAADLRSRHRRVRAGARPEALEHRPVCGPVTV
jgi:hypothetical protein